MIWKKAFIWTFIVAHMYSIKKRLVFCLATLAWSISNGRPYLQPNQKNWLPDIFHFSNAMPNLRPKNGLGQLCQNLAGKMALAISARLASPPIFNYQIKNHSRYNNY